MTLDIKVNEDDGGFMGRYDVGRPHSFGAAYYDEYLMMKGIDRIDEDMADDEGCRD